MRRLTAIVFAVALLAPACGGGTSGSSDPEETLSRALESLRSSTGLTVELSLRSTPESIRALASESGESLGSEDARKILDSSLRISSAMRGEPGQGAAQIVLTIAGNEDLELRTVDKVLYVRADVRGLLETFGQNPAMADRLAQQAPASGLDFVGPLVEGRWIALEGLEELLGKAGAPATPTADQQRILEELVASFERSTDVTSEGSDDVGEHLVASVPLREVYEDLQGVAGQLAPSPPGGLPSSTEIPDEDIRIDLWVDGGRLTLIEFNFLQLRDVGDAEIPPGVSQLALRVAVEDFSGDVAAPPDAVPVNLQEVVQGFLGVTGAASAAGAAAVPSPS